MGTYVRTAIKTIGTTIVIGLLSWSCGKSYDKVKGVRGPKGDKGDQGTPGEKGQDGQQGPQGPSGKDGANGKDGTNGKDGKNGDINLPPTNPYPPIIIVMPGQQCTPRICPASNVLVCACIEGTWKTISIAQHDIGKVRIRNYGRCEDWVNPNDPTDCIFWPRPQQPPVPVPTVTVTVGVPAPAPTVTVTAIPIPQPTITVTAYPIPVPTVTVTPVPRPNQC